MDKQSEARIITLLLLICLLFLVGLLLFVVLRLTWHRYSAGQRRRREVEKSHPSQLQIDPWQASATRLITQHEKESAEPGGQEPDFGDPNAWRHGHSEEDDDDLGNDPFWPNEHEKGDEPWQDPDDEEDEPDGPERRFH